MPRQTPSQTVGPFFWNALTPHERGPGLPPGTVMDIARGAGRAIHIEGRVLDGAGDPVADAMVEIWQAGSDGRYPADHRGFGRVGTEASGKYAFLTVKPGPVASGAAPHVNVAVFARGLLNHAFTRIYFEDEAATNASDKVLASVEPARRDTLLARRRDGSVLPTYEFTIRLQGDRETVFFDA